MKKIAESKNNKNILYDPINSHAATHIEDTPELINLVKEVISEMILKKEKYEIELDMGRVIGKSDLVRNDPGDKIVYAMRKNREGYYTPFNKTKSAQSASKIFIALKEINNCEYELLSTFISSGECPPFPGEENSTEESIRFWNKHSLVFGNQEIIEETLTSKCPWNDKI